jgi:hypothetical protein
VQYVSLSYCWGPNVDDVLKTTSQNIKSHYERLPFALVPQTIRDAMTVCWKLGVPDIWVDSLCIIQDDAQDWSRESSKMLDVYTYSYFTIAIKEPASCKLGFLGKQLHGSQDQLQPTDLNILDGPEDNMSQLARTREHEDLGARWSLDKRAWCFQESVLPNRILSFNGNHASWGCLQRSSDVTILGEYGIRLKTALRQGFSQDIACGSLVQNREWTRVVEEYSNRTLTRGTDKLNAISGLATPILKAAQAEVLQETDKQLISRNHKWDQVQCRDLPESSPEIYLAGLWRSHFVAGLA